MSDTPTPEPSPEPKPEPLPHHVRDQIDHIMDVFDFGAVLAYRKAHVGRFKGQDEEHDSDLRMAARKLLEEVYREGEDTWRMSGSFMVIKFGEDLTLVGVIDTANANL